MGLKRGRRVGLLLDGEVRLLLNRDWNSGMATGLPFHGHTFAPR